MIYRSTLVAAFALFAVAGSAHADGVRAMEGQSIDLGSMTGTAYYTVEPDGYHVVATFQDTRSGSPLRMEGTLASGQRMVISTPGGRSGAPHRVEISHELDGVVLVHPVALTN